MLHVLMSWVGWTSVQHVKALSATGGALRQRMAAVC